MKLGEVFLIERGGSPRPIKEYITDSANGINWIKIGDTQINSKYIKQTSERIKPEGLNKSRFVKKGNLLLTNSMSFGRPYISNIEGAIHDGWLVIKNITNVKIDPEYVFYVLSSSLAFAQFNKLAIGSTVRNLNTGIVASVAIPLAPLPTQRAIVRKIETLFASLDKGISDLKTAQQQLKIYRQAVLKKAFEGRLTNKDVKEGELPKGWEWVTLEEATSKIQDGSHFSPKHQSLTRKKDTYPYITSKNIKNGTMDLSNITYVNQDFHKSIYSRCDPIYGDVLLTKDGVNTGNITLNTLKEPISLLSSVCLIRPTELIEAKFILYYIQSPKGFRNLTGQMTGTAIKRIILKRIKETTIPLPPLAEQQSIVREIESRLSVCDKIEQSISEALEKAEALRQSILKKAFDGRLLSEEEIDASKREPDYEPAAVLLERIKKEKHGK